MNYDLNVFEGRVCSDLIVISSDNFRMNLKGIKYDNPDQSGKLNESEADKYLLDFISEFKVENKAEPDMVFLRINSKILSKRENRPVLSYSLISVAASVLIIISIFLFTGSETQKYESGPGEVLEIDLPDHSKVHLNGASSLSYNERKWHNKRNVRLTGEAFFDVKKGSRFRVETREATAEVLGTSFVVNTRDNRFLLKCYTGRVKVSGKRTKENVEVAGGEAVRLSIGYLSTSTHTIGELPDWMKRSFTFRHQRLDKVFDAIQEHYRIDIEYPAMPEKYFTGTINCDDINSVLDIICITMGLEYALSDNKVIIKSKKFKLKSSNYEN